MRTVYKYKLEDNSLTLGVYCGANFLKAAVQNGVICVWAEVDTDNAQYVTEFKIVGTGHEIDDSNFDYIDTIFVGDYVWHIYSWETEEEAEVEDEDYYE